MIPQRADITALVLGLLGDTQVAGGSVFTTKFQAPHLSSAYQELFTKLDNIGASRVQREGYFLMPAYTGVFYPSVAGLYNFGGPVEIRERGTATAYAISAVTPSPTTGTCAVTVAALPTTVVTGTQVEVYGIKGVSDDVNDQWTITVNSPTSIVLNGCAAEGTYTTGGYVIYSSEQWSDPLVARDDTDNFPTSPVTSLAMFSWQRGVMKFPVVNAAREIRLRYQLSGSLPVTCDSMGIEDSLNFLGYRTAQLCAAAKGMPRSTVLTQQADYHLQALLQKGAREQQVGESVIPSPFRGKRNVRTGVW
jgi:hypothetical protein